MANILRVVYVLFALGSWHEACGAERKVRTEQEVVALVRSATDYLKIHGRSKTLDEMNKPTGRFVDGELYVFAFDANGDGIPRANAAIPSLVGKRLLDMRDPDGAYFVKKFFEVANSRVGHGWVDYKWPNPMNANFVETKTSYIEKAGDLVFGCGMPKAWAHK